MITTHLVMLFKAFGDPPTDPTSIDVTLQTSMIKLTTLCTSTIKSRTDATSMQKAITMQTNVTKDNE